MKLKFINFILASALLVGSAQIFTSCKDNAADIDHKLEQKDKALEKLIGENTSKINDLRNDLNAETNSRIADVNALNARLNETNGKITDLYQQLGNCATKEEFNIVKGQMDQLIEAAGGDIDKLVEAIKTIEKNKIAIEQIDKILNEQGTGVLDRLTSVESALVVAETAISNLEDSISHHSELLTKIGNDAAEALAKAIVNEGAIQGLQSSIDAINEAMGDLASKDYVDELKNQLDEIAAAYASTKWVQDNFATKAEVTRISSELRAAAAKALSDAKEYAFLLFSGLDSRLTDLENDHVTRAEYLALLNKVNNIPDNLQDTLDDLNNRITALENASGAVVDLTEINNRLDELAARLNNIVVHQAVSPALGTFNIMGLTNKLLLAYSGHSVQGGDVYFPAMAGENTLNGAGLFSGINVNEGRVKIDAGQWLMNGTEKNEDGHFGVVYMSLNPNNVKYQNFTYDLVSSKTGVNYGATLNVRPSDTELKIGYGRSQANGFYAADVTVDAESVKDFQFILSNTFKEKVKDIINSPRTLTSPSTIANLAGVLYSEVNGAFPALAVSASWNPEKMPTGADPAWRINSEYNLGAIAVNPLSFKLFATLEESGKLDKIAHYMHMPDLSSIPDRFNAYFDELTGKLEINLTPDEPFTVAFEGFTINANVKLNINSVDEKDIEIVTKWTVVDGLPVPAEKETINPGKDINEALQGMKKDLDIQLGELFGNLEDDLNKQLKPVLKSIETQVNDLFDSMSTSVNTQISDILNDMKNKADGLISGALGRYNAISDRMEVIINKMKTIITHPFYYVQPCLVYKNDSHVGLVSSNAAMPSVFKVNDANTAVTLIPTTYTLEAAVPCYLKYVAVVEAIDKDGNNNESVVNEINALKNMNTVLPGDIYTLHMAPLKLKKGYTYKIVYQAMDYSGVICGRDYYVTVK